MKILQTIIASQKIKNLIIQLKDEIKTRFPKRAKKAQKTTKKIIHNITNFLANLLKILENQDENHQKKEKELKTIVVPQARENLSPDPGLVLMKNF